MKIQQFEDKNLAHYSYAILSEGEIALVDPERNPQKYYDFAKANNAKIKAIIETHPHADFISSHVEISKATGAKVYVSELLGAEYEHTTFDDGDAFTVGNVTMKALNTPGHSPDCICVIAVEEGKEKAVFTGDTLFIGNCGRPDLRENVGNLTANRKVLAGQMYHSLRGALFSLPDDVMVYPSHGAGSLCGAGLSAKASATMGEEKQTNWSLQPIDETMFVDKLLDSQPFAPKYFESSVKRNKKGAKPFAESINEVVLRSPIQCEGCVADLKSDVVVVDTRNPQQFKKSHLKNSINIPDGGSFETWLGSVISPEEKFYLVAESEEKREELIARVAKIGYERQIEGAFILNFAPVHSEGETPSNFTDESKYTILDVRSPKEVATRKVFENAVNIPLYELRERVGEVPIDKPIVVHCAAGYRSAVGSSILESAIDFVSVYDLGEAIKTY